MEKFLLEIKKDMNRILIWVLSLPKTISKKFEIGFFRFIFELILFFFLISPAIFLLKLCYICLSCILKYSWFLLEFFIKRKLKQRNSRRLNRRLRKLLKYLTLFVNCCIWFDGFFLLVKLFALKIWNISVTKLIKDKVIPYFVEKLIKLLELILTIVEYVLWHISVFDPRPRVLEAKILFYWGLYWSTDSGGYVLKYLIWEQFMYLKVFCKILLKLKFISWQIFFLTRQSNCLAFRHKRDKAYIYYILRKYRRTDLTIFLFCILTYLVYKGKRRLFWGIRYVFRSLWMYITESQYLLYRF